MSTRSTVENTKSNIDTFKITSNYGPTENFGGKCPDLTIYESVFDSTVRAKAVFVDAGYNPSEMTSHDKVFNLTGGEKTEIVITDNYMKTTRRNLLSNGKIEVLVYDKQWRGYRVKGKAKYYNSGKWLEFVKSMKENKSHPAKGAIVINVNKIEKLK